VCLFITIFIYPNAFISLSGGIVTLKPTKNKEKRNVQVPPTNSRTLIFPLARDSSKGTALSGFRGAVKSS
jgi:hypothetical protein